MDDSEIKRPAKVFLSYGSSDKASARFIADALRKGGISTWFDEWEIRVGDTIVQKIEDGVKSRDRQYLDMRGTKREIGLRRLVEQLSAVPAISFKEMTPQTFERLVGDLLVALGFAVESHSGAHDKGIDFTAIYNSRDPFGVEKKETWLVESKLYSKSRVSVSVLREAVGLLVGGRKAAMALIVTSGNITSEGRSFLEVSEYGSRIRVIEGPELTNLIAQYPALIERYFPDGGSRA